MMEIETLIFFLVFLLNIKSCFSFFQMCMSYMPIQTCFPQKDFFTLITFVLNVQMYRFEVYMQS